jgi:hypothetical protein
MMIHGAKYTPPGPGAEAAIEVEIQVPEGTVYLRIPFSVFSKVFSTASDRRELMLKAFIDKNLGIWPMLSKKIPSMLAGEVYTVTVQDLS